MRILVVTDNRYWRNELGSQRRISSLCNYFIECGHTIEVLFTGYLYQPDREALKQRPLEYALSTSGHRENSEKSAGPFAAILEFFRTVRSLMRQIGLSADQRLKRRDLNVGQPFRNFLLQMKEPKLLDFEQGKTLPRFRLICERFTPDVVLVEYVRLAWILKQGASALPPGCLKLIDTHDVQHERQSRFHRQGEIHEIDISPAEEARALRLGDVLLAIHDSDAAKLRKLVPGKEVVVVGFPSPLHMHPKSSRPGVHIGFFGSSMLPNRNAAEKLVFGIFPLLRKRFGVDVQLHIFGRVCDDIDQASAGPGVHFRGFVAELSAAYSELDIIANPVDFGGGLKIKNVEALSHGLPLVTTSIGAEGLALGAGTAFWLATDEEDFVRKIGQLICDVELRATLSQLANEFAVKNFSRDAAFSQLGDVLKRAKNRSTLAPI
jgi:glycosyltransferase involved in cell wall biosynthesis